MFDPKAPASSYIALAPDEDNDGDLQVREIYGLSLSRTEPLVVISACDSALGGTPDSDDVQSLARAFLIGGARSVVASLWKVDDEATKELMVRFYENMIERELPVAEALQEAQHYLRTNFSQWSAPQYWAAFTLIGLPT